MARIISDPLSFKEGDIIPQGLHIRYVEREEGTSNRWISAKDGRGGRF